MSEKPELSDYGLKGIDSRPLIDTDAMPITTEERDAAIERIIEWEVGNVRTSKFRRALNEWEWEIFDQ